LRYGLASWHYKVTPFSARMFVEAWRDQAAIDAHFRAPHLAEWRASWPAFGVSDRKLTLYEVATERTL